MNLRNWYFGIFGAWVVTTLAWTNLSSASESTVFAEGEASSPVAEHVVKDLARRRAIASATSQCRNLGYSNTPAVIPGSGYDTAHYKNRMWYAHYWANFDCTGNTAPIEFKLSGPWLSEDGSLEFLQVRGLNSWWTVREQCRKQGYDLPTWEVMSENFPYLHGTTPAIRNAWRDSGCPSACPINFWTVYESENGQSAFLFETASSTKMDPRPMSKAHRTSVLCVRSR